MAKSTGKVREKSGNFVSPEKWEPCRSGKIVSKRNNMYTPYNSIWVEQQEKI